MSRIGKKPVILPADVKIDLSVDKAGKEDSTLTINGPKGTLTLPIHPKVKVQINEKEIILEVVNKEDRREKALWGLFRALD
jgi:large subunit ribosomal protein L6